MFARGASQQEDEELLVPENFAMVEPGVYRSSFPRSKNMRFLKTLGLKSVVALIPEDYPVHMVEFYKQCNVQLFHHGLDGNKWPFKEIDEIDFKVVLRDVLDPANRPLLIHCNKGKHRTGNLCHTRYVSYATLTTMVRQLRISDSYLYTHSSGPDLLYFRFCGGLFT